MKFIFASLVAIVALSDACLKIGYSVPPACACKALGLGASDFRDYVDLTSEYYTTLENGLIRAPKIAIDDCSISMYCEGNAELFAFDTDQEERIGEYALDALCNPYGQKWEVYLNEEFKSFTRLYGVCLLKPLPPANCSPIDKATFLFAQSTDVLVGDAQYGMGILLNDSIKLNFANTTRFQTVAYVRFDMEDEEEIVYYNGWKEAAAMMTLIDRPRSLNSISGGSDVLKMIERFLDTSPHSVCGSYIQILMGRYPAETDFEILAAKLRHYHVYLAIHLTTEPVEGGGSHPETMYDLAIETMGFCGHGATYPGYDQPDVFTSYMVYAENLPIPAGNGSIILPPLSISYMGLYNIHVALQGPWDVRDSFRRIRLTWFNAETPLSEVYEASRESIQALHGRTNTGIWTWLDAVSYNFTLDYSYASDNIMLIRVMSKQPVNNWLLY